MKELKRTYPRELLPRERREKRGGEEEEEEKKEKQKKERRILQNASDDYARGHVRRVRNTGRFDRS